jgi:hypothetical protein
MDKIFNYLMITLIVALCGYMIAKSLIDPPTCTPSPTGCVPILKAAATTS